MGNEQSNLSSAVGISSNDVTSIENKIEEIHDMNFGDLVDGMFRVNGLNCEKLLKGYRKEINSRKLKILKKIYDIVYDSILIINKEDYDNYMILVNCKLLTTLRDKMYACSIDKYLVAKNIDKDYFDGEIETYDGSRYDKYFDSIRIKDPLSENNG